jgi:hypothetical protein
MGGDQLMGFFTPKERSLILPITAPPKSTRVSIEMGALVVEVQGDLNDLLARWQHCFENHKIFLVEDADDGIIRYLNPLLIETIEAVE